LLCALLRVIVEQSDGEHHWIVLHCVDDGNDNHEQPEKERIISRFQLSRMGGGIPINIIYKRMLNRTGEIDVRIIDGRVESFLNGVPM
jgi:hypothetical protein